MTAPSLPERGDVLQMLASYGDRAPQEVGEQLGSLELTWLIAQAEQRYRVVLDLSDEVFARMQTVSSAVDVLRTTIGQVLAADNTGQAAEGSKGADG
jgi:hypothetical protein